MKPKTVKEWHEAMVIELENMPYFELTRRLRTKNFKARMVTKEFNTVVDIETLVLNEVANRLENLSVENQRLETR